MTATDELDWSTLAGGVVWVGDVVASPPVWLPDRAVARLQREAADEALAARDARDAAQTAAEERADRLAVAARLRGDDAPGRTVAELLGRDVGGDGQGDPFVASGPVDPSGAWRAAYAPAGVRADRDRRRRRIAEVLAKTPTDGKARGRAWAEAGRRAFSA